MVVFIYEFITGGGCWSLGSEPPAGSLLAEGRAMAEALAADFSRLGNRTLQMADARMAKDGPHERPRIGSADEERNAFQRLAAAADWTVVIAPEFAGALLARCRWAIEAGGRLLSPGPQTIALASDKQRTAEHLAQHSIRVPDGVLLHGPQGVPAHLLPAVLKPLDGCGSLGIRLIQESGVLKCLPFDQPQRLERFIPGLAASVAVLCGPELLVPLPACQQHLSRDGTFAYLGGRTPLAAPLDHRARKLAVAAVRTLPDPLGFLGVDLVLGAAADGSGDYVIEINPRLTTSYVGLRALCRDNLAAAMLDVACGRRPTLSWHEREVQFAADGRVTAGENLPPPLQR